jgi:hypothetical protein
MMNEGFAFVGIRISYVLFHVCFYPRPSVVPWHKKFKPLRGVEAEVGTCTLASLTMKSYLLLAVVFAAGLVGCSTEPPSPPPPRPFVGILSAEKVGNGPREKSSYNVVLIYENAVPEKNEIKIGFGYIPSAEEKKKGGKAPVGIYAVSKSEIIHQKKGELHLTIDSSSVHGPLDGKIHAILSKYPHGEEWGVLSHSVLELQPD